MDLLDLPALWTTKDYADCTLVSADGVWFGVHRVVLARCSALRELIDQAAEPERRVHLTESSPVIQHMLEWMYSVAWEQESADFPISMELTDMMELANAAEKVRILFCNSNGT